MSTFCLASTRAHRQANRTTSLRLNLRSRTGTHGTLSTIRTRGIMSTAGSDGSMDSYELFNYTSGRWLYNDSLRHLDRKQTFNVTQLRRLAAESVQRTADDVLSFEKLAEGGFNRSFVVTMRDGFRLVARIPYPSTVPRELAVASEAATLSFLRSRDIPVPEVYAYSTSAQNAAKTEFMFMELVGSTGSNLGDIWPDLTQSDCLRFARSLVDVEARLFNIKLPAYGSLFYVKDLPAHIKKVQVPNTPFCIGPDTAVSFWLGRRGSVSVDRGPFTSPRGVMNAGAMKEIAYLQAYGRPLYPYQRIRRETFHCEKQQPNEYIEVLNKYLQIAPCLVPTDDILLQPTIRHPDLRPTNVFVSKDMDIISLIDWQHCSILPLFLQCGLPPNLVDSMVTIQDELVQEIQPELSTERLLHGLYVSETARRNETHSRALRHSFSAHRRSTYQQSCNTWDGDTMTLKSGLVSLAQNWERVIGSTTPCPISFAPDEEQQALRLEQEQRDADAQFEESRIMFGIGPDGWVPCEHYEQIKEAMGTLKANMIESAESELDRDRIREHWVYDDMDEEEYR